jgi:uncharacterized protein DUF6932
MIPPFDEGGDLPLGLHTATWVEFRARFCRFIQSDRRLQLCQRLEQLVNDARASGIVTSILVGGSMVKAIAEPNDFDCIIVLQADTRYETLRPDQLCVADAQAARNRYGGDIFIAREGQSTLAMYIDFFSRNRDGKIVGLIEVIL